MSILKNTRLRFVTAKTQEELADFLGEVTFSFYVFGAPQWDGKVWTLWFTPGVEVEKDIQSVRLEDG